MGGGCSVPKNNDELKRKVKELEEKLEKQQEQPAEIKSESPNPTAKEQQLEKKVRELKEKLQQQQQQQALLAKSKTVDPVPTKKEQQLEKKVKELEGKLQQQQLPPAGSKSEGSIPNEREQQLEKKVKELEEKLQQQQQLPPESSKSGGPIPGEKGQPQQDSFYSKVCEFHLGDMEEKKKSVHKEEDIEISELIGDGYFGKTYKVKLKKENPGQKLDDRWLALKIPYKGSLEEHENEIAVLMKITGHENVIQFRGVVSLKSGFQGYLVDHCDLGRLDTLHEKFDLSDKKVFFSIARGLFLGLNHLHTAKIIHRDIACRNILVGKDWQVRIGSFGLSVMAPTGGCPMSFNERLPWPWMSPETLRDKMYTFKSDVWSAGVALWEVLCKGNLPYADNRKLPPSSDVIPKIISGSECLRAPTSLPKEQRWQLLEDGNWYFFDDDDAEIIEKAFLNEEETTEFRNTNDRQYYDVFFKSMTYKDRGTKVVRAIRRIPMSKLVTEEARPAEALVNNCLRFNHAIRPSACDVLLDWIPGGHEALQATSPATNSLAGTFGPGLPPLPTIRVGSGVCLSKDGMFLYVIGSLGRHDGACFDFTQGVWHTVSDMSQKRASFGLCMSLDGQAMYAVGGYGEATMEKYEFRESKWILMEGDQNQLSCCRDGLGLCLSLDGAKMFALGGEDEDGEMLDSMEAYDFKESKWTALEAKMTNARKNFAACLTPDGKYIAAVGGFDNENDQALDSIEMFNIAEGKWEEAGRLNVARHSLEACISPDGKFLYVLGGCNQEEEGLDSIEVFQWSGSSWNHEREMKLKHTRYNHGACMSKDGKQIFIVGGRGCQAVEQLRL